VNRCSDFRFFNSFRKKGKMEKMQVDICCDMGESFGHFNIGNDEAIMRYISTANVACGFHAGDPVVIEKTIDLALRNNVAIGAHPGYPDILGFGRRKMELSSEETKAYVKYQIGALKAMVESRGDKLQHVWLHGALNGTAAKDNKIANAIIEGILEIDQNIIFVHRPGLATYEIAKRKGLKVAVVVGVDIEYTENGIAVPNKTKDNLLPEEAASKAVKIIKEKKVRTISRKNIPMKVDSILVHGDTINAIDILKEMHKQFQKENIEIASLRKTIC
jgi:5-oxoprolinase (ATP-hydrolysing) subunit A